LCYCVDEEIDFLFQVAIQSPVEYPSGASDRLFCMRVRMRMVRASKNLATMVMIQVMIYHTWLVLAILYL
jgi:hypothetical protein